MARSKDDELSFSGLFQFRLAAKMMERTIAASKSHQTADVTKPENCADTNSLIYHHDHFAVNSFNTTVIAIDIIITYRLCSTDCVVVCCIYVLVLPVATNSLATSMIEIEKEEAALCLWGK